MDKIVIRGGERLAGEVAVSGAKNSALPILASTLLSEGTHRIQNVPKLADVATICRLLKSIGARIEPDGDGTLGLSVERIGSSAVPYDLVKTMRASILVLGPLLARCGEANVSLPGGCAIGARPINLHLLGLSKMGAEVSIEHGYVRARASHLSGARIYLDLPTVTGTENLMMAATLARGTTVIENAACEPEVVDLARFLTARGAKISGAGTNRVTIDGVEKLSAGEYLIMPDRIEAGSLMVASAITGGDIFLRGARKEDLAAPISKLREAGARIVEEGTGIRVEGRRPARSVDVTTSPFPGFPTDMQAQMMALMSIGDGLSVITETIFESRFTHVAELRRMGADIKLEGNHAVIQGVKGLSGAPVMASDLRASASLILAGLAAEGETEVYRVYHLDRGYERLDDKLAWLGAKIRREKGRA